MRSNKEFSLDFDPHVLLESIESLRSLAALAPVTQVAPGVIVDTPEPVSILRLDRLQSEFGPQLAGNKLFKLLPLFHCLRAMGVPSVTSFGGYWSNHLWSLSAMARHYAMSATALINGEMPSCLTPTLCDARAQGMQLRFLSRKDYRRLMYMEGWDALPEYAPRSYVVPLGGSGALGILGSVVLGQIAAERHEFAEWRCAAGSATTAIGLAFARLSSGGESPGRVVALSVADSPTALEKRAEQSVRAFLNWLSEKPIIASALELPHTITVDDVMRVLEFRDVRSISLIKCQAEPAELSSYRQRLEQAGCELALDPVYTGPLVVHSGRERLGGLFDPGQSLLFHTGGQQGARQYGDESSGAV